MAAVAAAGERAAAATGERVKMTCPSCGYQCVPQWMNDEASCLKCFAVLRRRAAGAGPVAGKEVNESRRQVGEVSTFKHAPGSAMESESGHCPKAPNSGAHLWKFGKCSYCSQAEPPRGAVARAPPTAATAKTTKPPAAVATPPAAAAAPAPAAEVAEAKGERGDRQKVECQFCGYKCIPQWLNDQAHCLKCQAVLKVQPSIHGGGGGAAATSDTTRRAPGEVSTNKASPGDRMEHSSGTCAKSPSGAHIWRFGKCAHCGAPEGQTLKGSGVVANPGSVGACDKGGKCIFKFAKCSKCGRKEF